MFSHTFFTSLNMESFSPWNIFIAGNVKSVQKDQNLPQDSFLTAFFLCVWIILSLHVLLFLLENGHLK